MSPVKGQGWSPERRARQAQRIRDTMAVNPGMSERGRTVAAQRLKTQEGRAKALASLKKARAVFDDPERFAARQTAAMAGLKELLADRERAEAFYAKRNAARQAKNKRLQMMGLQCPPELRRRYSYLRANGLSRREALAEVFKATEILPAMLRSPRRRRADTQQSETPGGE